jgi:CelD/BcsL family acetyltransferase involved in cellulose biosynthesis
MSAMPRAELLDGHAAVDRHGDDWRRLAEARSNAFATPEWFAAWYRHYGAFAAVFVAAVFAASGKLIGIVPLVRGFSGMRMTRFAGGNLADLVHPASAETDEVAVAQAVGERLRDDDSRAGAIVLDNVDGAADWWREMGSAAGLRVSERGRSVGPYAHLTGLDFDGFLRSRSSSFRRRMRRIDRRIEREARLEAREVGPAEVDAGIETLFELHDRRWAERGGSSLASPVARAFHLDFARAASAQGWLRLWLFEHEGTAVGAFYGWRVGNRFAFYQSGFDPDYGRLSLGLFLHARMVEQAIAEGAEEYDMLLGDERYKARFAESVRDLRTVVLSRPLSREGLVIGAEIGARRVLRTLPPSIRTVARQRLAGVNARTPTGRRR